MPYAILALFRKKFYAEKNKIKANSGKLSFSEGILTVSESHI